MSHTSETSLCLTHNIWKVRNITKLCEYYQLKWGMELISSFEDALTNKKCLLLGFFKEKSGVSQSKEQTFLELITQRSPTDSASTGSDDQHLINHTNPDDVYWKIGFNAPDVELAVMQLQRAGVDVTPAKQLKKSGFFTHLIDPEGFKIELLQFTFDDHLVDYQKLHNHPLKQQPVLGMVSLRVRDIQRTLRFYCDILGMKLLCRVDESDTHGFKLYFTAFTREVPPSADIDAVENREWLFQRPYTVLEFLVYDATMPALAYKPVGDGEFGFVGLGMACDKLDDLQDHLKKSEVAYEMKKEPILNGLSCLIIHDPDGIPIRVAEI